jgi:hypothetical protein
MPRSLGVAGTARMTPAGFLPEEDQGAFFIASIWRMVPPLPASQQ